MIERGNFSNMLEIKNLTKIYPNGKKAVSDLSITIEDGDLYGFIGKNGAGKTTTLKACLTIHDYDTCKSIIFKLLSIYSNNSVPSKYIYICGATNPGTFFLKSSNDILDVS